jgi:ZIP family zinc transporter
MEKSGWARNRIRLLWWAIIAVSAFASALGFGVVDASGTLTGALVSAFAAGALLTMIADEMAPEAYDRASIYAGLATVGGFGLAVWLTTLE